MYFKQLNKSLVSTLQETAFFRSMVYLYIQ